MSLLVTNDVSEEIAAYAQIAAAQVSKALEAQIASAVARLLDDATQSVRIALAVTLATDEKGGLITPELTLRRTETGEKLSLTPFRIGQLELLLEADSAEEESTRR